MLDRRILLPPPSPPPKKKKKNCVCVGRGVEGGVGGGGEGQRKREKLTGKAMPVTPEWCGVTSAVTRVCFGNVR